MSAETSYIVRNECRPLWGRYTGVFFTSYRPILTNFSHKCNKILSKFIQKHRLLYSFRVDNIKFETRRWILLLATAIYKPPLNKWCYNVVLLRCWSVVSTDLLKTILSHFLCIIFSTEWPIPAQNYEYVMGGIEVKGVPFTNCALTQIWGLSLPPWIRIFLENSGSYDQEIGCLFFKPRSSLQYSQELATGLYLEQV
jgi:hypothetical protein